MFTSKELSKKLADNGFKLKSNKCWAKCHRTENSKRASWILLDGGVLFPGDADEYPAYDILNDICVKYAREFFGEEPNWETDCKQYEIVGNTILGLLQRGEIEHAEDYIWDNCKFNPENK